MWHPYRLALLLAILAFVSMASHQEHSRPWSLERLWSLLEPGLCLVLWVALLGGAGAVALWFLGVL